MKNNKLLWVVFGVLVVAFLVVFGVYYLKLQDEQKMVDSTQKAEVTPPPPTNIYTKADLVKMGYEQVALDKNGLEKIEVGPLQTTETEKMVNGAMTKVTVHDNTTKITRNGVTEEEKSTVEVSGDYQSKVFLAATSKKSDGEYKGELYREVVEIKGDTEKIHVYGKIIDPKGKVEKVDFKTEVSKKKADCQACEIIVDICCKIGCKLGCVLICSLTGPVAVICAPICSVGCIFIDQYGCKKGSSYLCGKMGYCKK